MPKRINKLYPRLNPHQGHRIRLKRQFLANPSSLLEHQLLELLLFFAIRRSDTNPLAHALIDRFGSLSGVLKASPEELLEVKGVGAHTAEFLHLFVEISEHFVLSDEPAGISAVNVLLLQALLYSSFSYDDVSPDDEQMFIGRLDDRLQVSYSEVFNTKDVEITPQFIAAWLARRDCERFIVAKYRADGAFDMSKEEKMAYRVKNALPRTELVRYMLLDDEAVRLIEIAG